MGKRKNGEEKCEEVLRLLKIPHVDYGQSLLKPWGVRRLSRKIGKTKTNSSAPRLTPRVPRGVDRQPTQR